MLCIHLEMVLLKEIDLCIYTVTVYEFITLTYNFATWLFVYAPPPSQFFNTVILRSRGSRMDPESLHVRVPN